MAINTIFMRGKFVMDIHYHFMSMRDGKLIANWESINEKIEKYRADFGDRIFQEGIEGTFSELDYPMKFLKKALDNQDSS